MSRKISVFRGFFCFKKLDFLPIFCKSEKIEQLFMPFLPGKDLILQFIKILDLRIVLAYRNLGF